MLLFLLNSCSQEQKEKAVLPSSSGDPGQILLIMQDRYKETKIYDTIKGVFQQEQVGLPQSEPIFDLITIPPIAFKNVLKRHRNIITFKIGEKYKEPQILLRDNIYARPQTYMEIVAPTEEEFIRYFNEKSGLILNHFHKIEIQRIRNTYKKLANNDDMKVLRKEYNVLLTFPNSYKIAAKYDDFVWISHERSNMSQGIFIYEYPYIDTLQLTKDALLEKRDEMLKKYVPGPRDSSYMTTEYRTELRHTVSTILNGVYTSEIRGLWRVEGDFMGGPFISLTTVDEKRNRLVTVEGFVYAPKYDKREYLRQLEAIIKTLSFE